MSSTFFNSPFGGMMDQGRNLQLKEAPTSPKITTTLSTFERQVKSMTEQIALKSDKHAVGRILRAIADELNGEPERQKSLDGFLTSDIDEEAKARSAKEARKAFYGVRGEAAKRSSCLFDPNSARRLSWDILVILPMLAYLTLAMPFQMCFGNEPRGVVKNLEDGMDLIFIADILLNFRTAFVDPKTGMVVWDDYLVAKHYIKSWFVLDTVSAIPWGMLEQGGGLSNLAGLKLLKSGRVLKAIKLLRFLKLSRLLKGSKFFLSIDPETIDRVEDFLADIFIKNCFRMLRICIVMGVICHFMACLWVLVGRAAVRDGRESWLTQDAVIQSKTDGEFEAADTMGGRHVGTIYLAAFYFCFTTMTTVGYGDIVAFNNSERVMCVALQALGAFVSAWVIASLTSIATQEDANAAFVAERLDAVSSYLAKMQIPADLGRRIRRHFRYYFAQKSSLDESAILHDMSTSLRNELSAFLVESGAMSGVVLFRCVDAVYHAKILPLLRPAVYGRDEIITTQGAVCVEAFIITEGFLSAVTVEELEDFDGEERFEYARQLKDQFHDFVTQNSGPVEGNLARKIPGDGDGGQSNGFGPLRGESRAMMKARRLESDFRAEVASAEEQAQKKVHLRVLCPGSTVDVLCALKVWSSSLETVRTTERTTCYAIDADDFHETFKENPEVLTAVQERIVQSQFQMAPRGAPATDAPNHGVPIFMHDRDTILRNETTYVAKCMRMEAKSRKERLRAARSTKKSKGTAFSEQ